MVFKGTLRTVKNVTNGYSDAEAKVRTATSNDSTIPSGAQLHELAQLSYKHEDFVDIVTMLDKRLNDKGKYWRHVYKSLAVVEYLLHSGSPKVAQYFRDNIYLIKTLKEFQHVDDTDRDVGADVRAKARELSRLLADDKSLAETRQRRKQMRDRMAGRRSISSDEPPAAPRRTPAKKPNQEDQDVQRALKLSQQEEAERRRQLEEQGKQGLFDDPKPAPRYVCLMIPRLPCVPDLVPLPLQQSHRPDCRGVATLATAATVHVSAAADDNGVVRRTISV
ncbi:hypothetical protein BC834DRAFT_829792 [Gloeopeniophorella convolvens]|nr:hypothetical protein BC834DRAFT_829792 [Gloeopeniophorella convolvens]